jgi:hypothetical protein
MDDSQCITIYKKKKLDCRIVPPQPHYQNVVKN